MSDSKTTAKTTQPYAVSAILETLLKKEDLPAIQARELMEAIIGERVPSASIAALAVALRAKGESVAELAAFASVMRARAVPIDAPLATLDTCGTGGDASHTFNISTAAALVAAGMGIPVAKHGGRASSSRSGSADVLAALGVKVDAKPECVARCIREAGVGFLFAPAFHPGMMHVAAVRRELGIRTVFNLLGPLSNPAGAHMQLLGVSEPALCAVFAAVLKELGSASAMIVCGAGADGKSRLDEISTFGPTAITRLTNGAISSEILDPAQLGLSRPAPNALHAGNPQESAEVIRGVLSGRKGPAREIVTLNAAAAAILSTKATGWADGLRLAEAAIDSGSAARALEKLVEVSNSQSYEMKAPSHEAGKWPKPRL